MKATTLTGLSHATTASTKRTLSRLAIALAIAAGTVLTAPVAEARITSIVIDCARSQSPTFCAGQSATFGGTSFGTVGQYEKLRGTAFGELDPTDSRNAVITDIELAPRIGGEGRVLDGHLHPQADQLEQRQPQAVL